MAAPRAPAPVVLTRAAEDNAPLAGRLASRGVPVLEWPATATEPLPLDPAEVTEALAEAQAVVLASRRAVRCLAGLRADASRLVEGEPTLAAVGPRTAEALETFGLRADLVGRGGAAALAEPLAERTATGDRVTIVCSEAARDDLHERLEALGRGCRRLAVHRPCAPPPQRHARRERGELTAVVCCSPSAGRHLLGWNPWLCDHPFVAIGETTATALRELGCGDVTTATAPTDEALEGAVRGLLSRAAASFAPELPR